MIALPDALATVLAGRRWTRDAGGESGGAVYRLDAPDVPDWYLKTGTGAVADAITDELARLCWLRPRAPVPALIRFARDADTAWLVTTALPGRNGDAILSDDPARAPAIATALGHFLRGLHAAAIDDCPFEAGSGLRLAHARRRLDAGAVDTDDFGADHAGWSAHALWQAMTASLPLPFDRVLTHGDLSLGNVFLDDDDQVTGIIDLGLAGIADPHQDIAILHENLGAFGAAAQDRFLAAYGIPAIDPARLRFHRCLDEFF